MAQIAAARYQSEHDAITGHAEAPPQHLDHRAARRQRAVPPGPQKPKTGLDLNYALGDSVGRFRFEFVLR
eukprot:5045568-Pyramimonas_sp.AAC.1